MHLDECHHSHAQSKALHISLWIAFIFMFVELVGGWIANSLALISDALHLFTDIGALALGLIVIRIARRPSTPRMSYGYHRAEILGAFASVVSLWALCGVLVYEAIQRLITPEEVHGPIVFVIAAIGLVANLLMMRVLHPTHTHSLNVKAAYLHVIGDLLGSVGVLLGGALIWMTGWDPIDPIITMAFALAMVISSWKVLKTTLRVLMESAPEGVDPTAIRKDLLKIPGVTEVHDLHIWSVSSKKAALSAHLVAESTHKALQEAHRVIEKNHNIHHMTIQVEDPAHFESRYCYDCEGMKKRTRATDEKGQKT